MSIPTREQASDFLSPLKGSLTVLLLHEASTKMAVARFLLGCVRALSLEVVVVDSDAFYSSNVSKLVGEANPAGEILLLPEGVLEIASLLPVLSSRRLTVIDDLNSLYSLASDGRRSQQLGILIRLLSYNARMNGAWVLATAYVTDQHRREARLDPRSLTAVGDTLIDTDLGEGRLRFKSASSEYWASGEYNL